MCSICIANGRINVPALQQCCSWRWPWELGWTPHYMLGANYTASIRVDGGVNLGGSLQPQESSVPVSQVCSTGPQGSMQQKKLIWSRRQVLDCCRGVLAPFPEQNSGSVPCHSPALPCLLGQ